MQIDVKVDADTVNKMVTDAIMGSVIGDELTKIVKKKVEELSRPYDNPIEKAVDREVQLIVNRLVNEKFKPVIEAKVNEMVTDEMMTRIASASFNSLLGQLEKLKHY